MTTAVPGRFPSYTLGKQSSGDKTSQTMGTPFGNIWGGNIGSAFAPTQRESKVSRGSGDLSPIARSGSAQLNPMSEAEPWRSRGSFWNSQEGSSQIRSTSGSNSPVDARGNGLVHHSMQDSQPFPTRSAVGQNGTVFSRVNGHQITDPPATAFKYAQAFPTSTVDELDNPTPYTSLPSKYAIDQAAPFKRNSQGSMYLGLGVESNSISSGRPSEFGAHGPGPLHSEAGRYPFENSLPSGMLNSTSRPSLPSHSLSFPSHGISPTGPSSAYPGLDQEMAGLFKDSMRIEEGSLSNSGVSPVGYPNPATQPFQPWPSHVGNNNRFSLGYQQDGLAEQLSRRDSPATNGDRSSINSPRFAANLSQRPSSANRPGSRNRSIIQDLERQQSASFLPPNTTLVPSYYGGNFSQQYAPHPTVYDPYAQNPGFRSPLQVSPYTAMPLNQLIPGVTVPVRPSRDQDPGKGVRSVLLEDYRANSRSKSNWKLSDIYGHVVEFSGDQLGSRFIQEKLQSANSDEKDQVFQEIRPNALQLMKDVFGNYVIQKFFEHGNQVQKKILASQMKGKVAELSTQMYACRVVQKALEHVLVEQQAEIVEELKPNVVHIVKDQNGNHVIQKIISMVPRLCVPFMMEAFRGQIPELAKHSYGCRVVQRMLEQGTEEEKAELMKEIHSCAQQLIPDQYGNYVAQHVIAHGKEEDRSKMIRPIINDLLMLSKHKYASNVVEKCIEHSTPEEIKLIKDKLMTATDGGSSPLQTMMKDQYGNYVVQKLLQQLDGEDRERFIEEMKPQLATLKKVANGRNITAIDRLMTAANENDGPKTDDGTQPLQIDVNSAAPTPGLTTEHSSPNSTNAPSTNLGTDEAVDEGRKADLTHGNMRPPPIVHMEEA